MSRAETWTTFDQALASIEKDPRAQGPGLILTPNSRLVCLDLDDVITPGVSVEPFAEELVERFGTYTEISLSGRGLHLFITTKDAPRFPPGHWRWKGSAGEHHLEIYHTGGRYIALTGKLFRFAGAGRAVEDRTAELLKLVSESEPDRTMRQGGRGAFRAVNAELMLSLFGELGLSLGKDAARHLFPCPFHDDANPSLSIHPERGWKCFSSNCGKSGGSVVLRETIRDLTDDEAECVARRTGEKLTDVLILRERLRRESDEYRERARLFRRK